MSANVISYKDNIPKISTGELVPIYWDTSFILNALIAPPTSLNPDLARDSQKFGAFLADEDVSFCFNLTSDFAINEVLFKRIKSKIKPRWEMAYKMAKNNGQEIESDWIPWLKRQHGLIIGLKSWLGSDIQKIERNLYVIRCNEDYNITGDALSIIFQYEMLPTDAYQVAIAQKHGINVFVSNDSDFLRLDGCTVYCHQ